MKKLLSVLLEEYEADDSGPTGPLPVYKTCLLAQLIQIALTLFVCVVAPAIMLSQY